MAIKGEKNEEKNTLVKFAMKYIKCCLNYLKYYEYLTHVIELMKQL